MRTKEEREAIRVVAHQMYLDGVSTEDIGKHFGIPERTMFSIMSEDVESWEEVKRARAQHLVDEGLRIVDESDPVTASLSRTRAQYRQWLASKLSRDYADKQDINIQGQIGILPILNITSSVPTPQLPDTIDVKLIDEKTEKENNK